MPVHECARVSLGISIHEIGLVCIVNPSLLQSKDLLYYWFAE